MRYVVTVILLFVSPFSFASNGKQAPDFNFSLDGQMQQLSQLKGHVVYVDFWASWCKPCRQSFPWLNQIQTQYAKQGLLVVGVNLDTEPELVSAFLHQVPAYFPITYDPDGKIAQQYELVGMPSSYLIDRDGTIRFSHKGFFSAKQGAYEQQIIALLQESE